jgi:hypothetical protein
MPVSTLDQTTPLPFKRAGTSGVPLASVTPIELRGLTPAATGSTPAIIGRMPDEIPQSANRSLAIAAHLSSDIEQALQSRFDGQSLN